MASFDIKKVYASLKCGFFFKWFRWWSHLVAMLYYIYMYMCLHDHDYIMDFYFMVILGSTTGLYGRPMTEVAYEEMLLSLHRGCIGVDSSGRVVRVSTWCHPCWTYSDQHQCGSMYFFGFQYIKPMYMYNVFKIYM